MTEEEFEREFWVSKDGTVNKIKDLNDGHLLNILKLLERAHAITLARDYICLPEAQMPRGDGANDAFDAEFDRKMVEGPEHTYSGYRWLLEEAIHRKITTQDERERYTSDMETSAVLKLGGWGNK